MIKNMTEGSPVKILLSFSMPMLFSMMFQQFYNIVDSVVAGKFIGVDALAAIGASYPITVLFIAVANGASVGAAVVVSQTFGANKLVKMKTSVSTSVIAITVVSIALTIFGTLFCSDIMRMINTPENIFADSRLYLKVYIWGLIFLFMYNTATAIFTGLGDSKTPLYFLIFSSLLNVALDILFVTKFQMGVSGIAWATFLAQGLSSILAIVFLFYRLKKIKVDKKVPLFNLQMLKLICKIAVPSIFQQSFVSVGQLCVQSLINSFGSAVVAGYAAAFKIHTFVIMTLATLANASSSFVAQNIGAKKIDRVKEGYKVTVWLTEIISVTALVVVYLFGDKLLGMFIDIEKEVEILNIGIDFVRTTAPFYTVVCIKIAADAVLRGAGDMNEFMATTFADLVLRVAFSYVFAAKIGYIGIYWAFPAGWILGTLLSIYYYMKGKWKTTGLLRRG